MRLTILIRDGAPGAWDPADAEVVKAFYDAHHAFEAAVEARGTMIAGSALSPSGATLSNRTEGPYAESVEQITGLYVIEVESREVAVELAKLLPPSYDLEIRDPMVLEGY